MTSILQDKLVPGKYQRLLFYFVFFCSGAAALVYEISWTRQIGLLFGHTVHAASIVLASYFAGMAIGYLVGAKLSSRVSPLIGYAFAELLVAVWAVMIPLLLGISESARIAPWLSSPSFICQTAIRGAFGFLLLLPATIALGVTLPMMAAYVTGGGQSNLLAGSNSSRVAFAYALNTAGALVGVLFATFYMLVVIGVRSSSFVAAAVSVLCALAAWKLSRGKSLESGVESRVEVKISPLYSRHAELCPLSSGLSALAFLSGFGILTLQVLYTRMFSLVFHNSTYTFGVVIAVFLASLTIGAALASQLQRCYSARRIIGVATGLGSFAVSVSILIFVWLTDLKYFSYGDSFSQYMTGAILLVTVVVAPGITSLGMMLPLVWTMAGKSGSAGQVVGNLTAINTLAAAIGAISASFVLLIWIGLWQSIVLIGVLFFVAAVFLLWQNKQKRVAIVLGGLVGVASVFALLSPIESKFDRAEYHERLVHRWNSAYGWIDVVKNEQNGSFKIRQNLHYRFGKTGGNAREFRQAHIPLLLHDDPQDVLFMGLGTGLTAGGAIPHPAVKTIVAVELVPEVIEAVRSLSKYNYNVVDHPKVEIRIDDARHYLLASDRQFDVIISDLFVPWESETGYLYTAEHYQIASERLKSGGLFCQWLPLYQLGPVEFESIANSFANVFPNTTIWWGQLETTSPVIALIGTRSPIEVDPLALAKRLNQLDRNLTLSDQSIATPERFWAHFIADWRLQTNALLNTDEHPRVEFLTPVSNRDQKMIKGKVLKQYFEDVLFDLPMNSAKLKGETTQESNRRRQTQRLILFGK